MASVGIKYKKRSEPRDMKHQGIKTRTEKEIKTNFTQAVVHTQKSGIHK